MATHSNILIWIIQGAWWAIVHAVTKCQMWLKQLSRQACYHHPTDTQGQRPSFPKNILPTFLPTPGAAPGLHIKFAFQQPLSWRLRHNSPYKHPYLSSDSRRPPPTQTSWSLESETKPIPYNPELLRALTPASCNCSLMSFQSIISEYRLKRGGWWEIFDS